MVGEMQKRRCKGSVKRRGGGEWLTLCTKEEGASSEQQLSSKTCNETRGRAYPIKGKGSMRSRRKTKDDDDDDDGSEVKADNVERSVFSDGPLNFSSCFTVAAFLLRRFHLEAFLRPLLLHPLHPPCREPYQSDPRTSRYLPGDQPLNNRKPFVSSV